MVNFSEENLKWLNALVIQAKEKTSDVDKQQKLLDLSNKLEMLKNNMLPISIKEKDIKETKEVIEELEQLAIKYSSLSDITSVSQYDEIKKQMANKLQYLSTYKDVFQDEATYLEEILKKEIKMNVVEDLVLVDKVSFTQAEKLVEKDKRYTILRDQVWSIKKLANNIKTKYDFHMKLWQMVFQSCSTASKEKHAAKYED